MTLRSPNACVVDTSARGPGLALAHEGLTGPVPFLYFTRGFLVRRFPRNNTYEKVGRYFVGMITELEPLRLAFRGLSDEDNDEGDGHTDTGSEDESLEELGADEEEEEGGEEEYE